MMSTPCLYAIVRFCPFVETEEFANVGIVMLVPGQNLLSFKLMTRRHARITNFFEQLDVAVFRTAMNNLSEEFGRAGTMLATNALRPTSQHDNLTLSKHLFAELIRPRETVVKFSNVRAVLAPHPKEKLDELFSYYVERDFVTKEYRETVLERGMRRWLSAAGLTDRFDKMEVGNDEYHATFPFVERANSSPVMALKPLNLAQDQPNKILDHGGQWLFRMETLKRKQLLPEKVLFAVDGPNEQGTRTKAYHEIIGALREVGAIVLPYAEKAKIMEFVARPH